MSGLDLQHLPVAPYPGLRPFTKAEWPVFFGRESMSQDVIGRLVDKHLVAVHGDSGCGKSSLIAASVLPILEHDQARTGGRWTTCILRPEDDPLAKLVRALASLADDVGHERQLALRRALNYGPGAPARLAALLGCDSRNNVCILFDQFEELFEHARRRGPAEARLITGVLAGLVQERPEGLHVILTMRSDYLGQCAQYQGFAEAVNESQYLVPRMERAALMRAVREPARLFDGSVSAELADRLIADAGTGQDQLPLIQHGLMLLWRRKTRGLADGGSWSLGLDDYDSAGSLSELLSNHADAVLETAAPTVADKAVAETLFRALADQNADGQAIRRRTSLAELGALTGAAPEALQAMLRPFRAPDASFLRPYGASDVSAGEAVDVSHEAFLRNWRRIADPERGWLAREIADGLQWQSLRLAARTFATDGRQLLSPAAASEGEGFLKSHGEAWSLRHGGQWPMVQTLVQASVEAAQRQARRERRQRFLSTAVAVLMMGLAGLAYWQWQHAEAQKRIVEAQRRAAELNEAISLTALSNVAIFEGETVAAVKLALAAWPRVGSTSRPPLRRTLQSLSTALPDLQENLQFKGHEDAINFASFSPDGRRIVTASEDNTARVWDATTGTLLTVLKNREGRVWSASFSPDGRRIVTASWGRTARIWDATTGTVLSVLQGHEDSVRSASFSTDGGRIVTASDDKTARIWDAATGAVLTVLRGHEGYVGSASFSSDGRRVVTSSGDMTARIWDAATGAVLIVLRGHSDNVESASFAPGGRRIVTASIDNTARIWDAATGEVLTVLEGHASRVSFASFSPDSQRIVTASSDKTARIWDVATGAVLTMLKDHEDSVTSASFSPDNRRIVTASRDKTARIWDATTGAVLIVLRGHQGILSASFSHDGRRVVTASEDNIARIWDAAAGTRLTVLKGYEGMVWSATATFSPDGRHIVTASGDDTARIWEAASGTVLTVLKGHDGLVNSASFSPDGRRIVTASLDYDARIWDAATGTVLTVFKGHQRSVTSASFSPDGRRIVTASGDRTARIWDAATGTVLTVLKGHEGPVTSASFSPNGLRIVTASSDNTARIWDAAAGTVLIVLKGHVGNVSTASFTPDGLRIVTASSDNTARIWDAATGAALTVLKGHVGDVTSASFSPDGRRVVTASSDNTARIWDISSLGKGDALAVACQRLGANTGLADVEARYGLGSLPPICGEYTSSPVDLSRLQ